MKVIVRKSFIIPLTAIFMISTLLSFVTAPLVHATSSSSFQSGRIMDDSIFFNTNTMTAGDIQSFLNSKMPSCDTNGSQSFSYYYNSTTKEVNVDGVWTTSSRAVYGQRYADFWNTHTSDSTGKQRSASYVNNESVAPYTCLKDYSQNIPAMPADAYCGAISASGASAATLIKTISSSCNINPEVLIVLLQKEQGLLTDDWPWLNEYQSATGFSCTDSAPCDPTFAGFFYQMYYGAHQFQKYVKQPASFNYAAGQTSLVLYNPVTSCGSSNITMQTQATAALYNYTPYQPNTAALNNLYGVGDSCSAYGNRNFWRYFNDWFGPTTSDSDASAVSFVRLNHSSGHVEIIGLSSISSYQAISRNNLSAYPAVPNDGSVIPITTTSISSISFVRLNHSSGRTEIATYSSQSGFQQLINYQLTAYPSVAPDGTVVPLFNPNGNLSFVRLNHSSGRVEIATFSWQSNYQKLVDYHLTAYPSVPADGAVIPLINPDGNLVLIRLNHSSGRTEMAAFSASSGYQQLADYKLTGYPAVTPDGSVVPIFRPNGDLTFVRLNHSSGRVELATFSRSSGFQQLADYQLGLYPAVTDYNQLRVLSSR